MALNIICSSNIQWQGEYTKSTVQLMQLLSQEHNILFVEYPATWKDVFSSILGKAKVPVSRMLGIKKRCARIKTEIGTTVWQLVLPPMLPLAFFKDTWLFDVLLKINAKWYLHSLRKHANKLGFHDPIMVNAYNPLYGLNLLNGLSEVSTVYYCYDVTTYRFGTSVKRIEADFVRTANMVICTSESLREKHGRLNGNCHLVKNGVDLGLFAPYAKKSYNGDAHKKVCYIGSLDHRFDIDTMQYVIESMPKVKFDFTGPLRNKKIKERLAGFANVAFYPPIAATKVPKLLSKYDAGIIPYLINEANKNVYPLKINEFLAIGLPVVANQFANLQEFGPLVRFAKKPKDFHDMLVEELENDSTAQIQKRIEFAGENSWQAKAKAFEGLLMGACKQKAS